MEDSLQIVCMCTESFRFEVFGNWLICRDLQTAQQFSEQYDVDATNLDGDTVNRRGAITGGYYDSKRVARISAMREIKNLKREITNMEQSIRQKKDKIGGTLSRLI